MNKQYKLVITTYAENEQYDAQREAFDAEVKRLNERRQMNYGNDSWPSEPRKWDEERSLEVTLTADEFAAVKRAALESFS